MVRYLAKRLGASLAILLGVSLITFILTFLVPTDPVRLVAGRTATPATVESIRHELGLDRPLPLQYLRYLGHLVQGDLGRSYLQRTSVSELIASRLPATMLLMAGAIACELLLGLPAGVFAATRRGRPVDRGAMVMLVYIHVVALGAIVLSGFWSLLNERFDPRSGKKYFGRIAGVGTLGGIVGGVVAERFAVLFPPATILLFLSGLHLLCGAITFFVVHRSRDFVPAQAPQTDQERVFEAFVHGRRRFVENKYRRIFKQGARDGDALLCADGKLHAAFAHMRVVAFRQ